MFTCGQEAMWQEAAAAPPWGGTRPFPPPASRAGAQDGKHRSSCKVSLECLTLLTHPALITGTPGYRTAKTTRVQARASHIQNQDTPKEHRSNQGWGTSDMERALLLSAQQNNMGDTDRHAILLTHSHPSWTVPSITAPTAGGVEDSIPLLPPHTHPCKSRL